MILSNPKSVYTCLAVTRLSNCTTRVVILEPGHPVLPHPVHGSLRHCLNLAQQHLMQFSASSCSSLSCQSSLDPSFFSSYSHSLLQGRRREPERKQQLVILHSWGRGEGWGVCVIFLYISFSLVNIDSNERK